MAPAMAPMVSVSPPRLAASSVARCGSAWVRATRPSAAGTLSVVVTQAPTRSYS